MFIFDKTAYSDLKGGKIMKRTIMLMVLLAAFAMGLSFAIAADEKAAGKASDNETAQTAKNMTYGQCVVAGVSIKNTCYDTSKQTQDSCRTNAGDDSAKVKQCKTDYKKNMKQCKTDFKAAKKDCIQKTKPGLWERMRYGLA